MKRSSKTKEQLQGCSEANMQAAVSFLKSRNFITDSFDIPDRYVLTPKGEAYRKLITIDVYKNVFCTRDDLLFVENQFDETLFM